MTVSTTPRLTAISFDAEIAKLTERFTGREWVFEEIDNWLKHQDERFFVLTGEPGVGKSAIAAHLTQTHQNVAAYHFCIAGESGTIQPNGVLLSLAAQLVEYFPDYAESLANIVKPLRLSVKAEINAQTIKDSFVRGVVIENLYTQSPQETLDIVLRRSLANLPDPPEEPVLILIDSLDEAVTYGDKENLVTLLSGVGDLPTWVRLIVTTRPDEQRVLSYLKTLKPYFYHLDELSQKSLKDVHLYVDERVAGEAIRVRLLSTQIEAQSLVAQITDLSKGNFLYTKVLLDDIESGGQPLDDLDALPKSLDEFYHRFLMRLKPEWETKYQIIFGILTVTKTTVTNKELINFIANNPAIERAPSETQLNQALGVVRQFLDVVPDNGGQNTYRLFHKSLSDYLLDQERDPVFWCSPKDAHRWIVEYCWQFYPNNWQECDRYGLRYLTAHLIELATLEKVSRQSKSYIDKLYSLLIESPNWMKAKSEFCGGDASYSADLRLAISNIANCTEPDQLLVLIQLFTAQSVVLQRVKQQTNVDLVNLVKAKREQEALAIARLRPSKIEQFGSLYVICNELPADGELTLRLLDEAEAITDKIESASDRVKALCYLGIAWYKAKAKDKVIEIFDKARRAIDSIRDDENRECAMKYYVVALAETKEFRVAEEMACAMDDGLDEKDEALSQLAFKLAQDGQISHAREVARLIQFGQDDVLQLIDHPSDKNQLRYVNRYLPENVFSSSQSFENFTNFSDDLIHIASALAQVNQFTQAKNIVHHISQQGDRERAWGRLVEVLVLENQLDQAKKVSNYIEDPWHQSLVMKQIAIALAKARLFDEAEARIECIQNKNSQAEALIQLGLSLHGEKQPIKANEVFRKVENIAQSLEPRTEILRSLAIALVMTQQLEWAEGIVRSMQPDENQAIALEKLAVALAQVGDFASAKRVVNNINEDKLRAKALLQIATICSQEKHHEEVDRLIHQVSEILSSVGTKQGIHVQVDALAQIADELSEFKHHSEINQIFSEVQEKVGFISFPVQDLSLGTLVGAMVHSGRLNDASKMISLMVDEYEKGGARSQLARGLADAKEFDHAEEITRLIKFSTTQDVTLMYLVTAAAQAKDFKRAERIAHSIESDWDRLLTLNQVAEALAQERCFKEAFTVLPLN